MSLQSIPLDCLNQIIGYLKPIDIHLLRLTSLFRKKKIVLDEIKIHYRRGRLDTDSLSFRIWIPEVTIKNIIIEIENSVSIVSISRAEYIHPNYYRQSQVVFRLNREQLTMSVGDYIEEIKKNGGVIGEIFLNENIPIIKSEADLEKTPPKMGFLEFTDCSFDREVLLPSSLKTLVISDCDIDFFCKDVSLDLLKIKITHNRDEARIPNFYRNGDFHIKKTVFINYNKYWPANTFFLGDFFHGKEGGFPKIEPLRIIQYGSIKFLELNGISSSLIHLDVYNIILNTLPPNLVSLRWKRDDLKTICGFDFFQSTPPSLTEFDVDLSSCRIKNLAHIQKLIDSTTSLRRLSLDLHDGQDGVIEIPYRLDQLATRRTKVLGEADLIFRL